MTRYDAVNGGFQRDACSRGAIGAQDRVLDVGCGNGQLTRLAAGRAEPGTRTESTCPADARHRAAARHAENVPNVSFGAG